ncbi:sel1 repeat family protein [Verrucomicrobia bacterium]|nr:sel1 repeat family protein [Verrucomicrobiota bacterium]
MRFIWVKMFTILLLAIAVGCSETGNIVEKQTEPEPPLEALLLKNSQFAHYFAEPEPFISLMVEWLILLAESEDEPEATNRFREVIETRYKSNKTPVLAVVIGMFEVMGSVETSSKGMDYIREAADQGLAEGEFFLGICYITGEFGIEADRDKGSILLRSAAESGSALAMNAYGEYLERSTEKKPDYRGAVRWYREAAEIGFPDAMVSLGLMYRNGRGVIKDYNEYVRLTEKAAVAGDVSAVFDLALAYQYGNYITQDNVKAYKWFNIASSMSPLELYREAREKLESSMSVAEIEEAQRISREFLALPEFQEAMEVQKKMKKMFEMLKTK